MTQPLYKSTIVIWSDFDPTTVELTDLAWEADRGSALLTGFEPVTVTVPSLDPDYVEQIDEFFSLDEDED